MKLVVKLLKDLNYRISSCESITAGLFSKTITDVPKASEVFAGSIIAYTNDAKIKVVGVKPNILKKYSAVSSECALAMAQNVKKIFKTNVAISFTGNAGPDSSGVKPVGLVYIAVVFDHYFLVEEINIQGNRSQIRHEVVKQSEQILFQNLKKIKKESLK